MTTDQSRIENQQSALSPDYQVELDMFRGPMDLLLHLVKRHEVDILDIPIAPIAEQYMKYLEVLQLIDVERVGDFLVLASTLMEIKSRMLLPRPEEGEAEEDDPRLELVKQLVEYKKFRDAAGLLEARAEEQSVRMSRQTQERPTGHVDPALQPIRQVEVWDLVSAFGRLMRETLAVQPKQIVQDETPMHVYIERVLARLSEQRRIPFTELFEPPRYRSRLVGLFLAVLELIRSGQIGAEQDEGFGEIVVVMLELQPSPVE